MERFDEIRNYAARLINQYVERDQMYDEMSREFFMEWTQAPTEDWIKPTMSPTGLNAVLGATRLLTATEPQLSVPYEETDAAAQQISDKLESASKAMWSGSGRVNLRPVHYEIVFSAVLFGEICGSVTKTSDLLKRAKMSKNKASIRRMQYVARETPYLFRTYNPSHCYPDFDAYGLRGMLRRVRTRWGEVLDTWGQAAVDIYGEDHEKDEIVIVNDWYDWEDRCVWLDSGIAPLITPAQLGPFFSGGSDTPLFLEPHELDFLPVVAQISEGSFLFDRPEQQRLPLLYGLWKSGLWRRENLALTVIFSLIFALGTTPLLKRKTQNKGEPIRIDRSVLSGIIDIGPDEDISPFLQQIIDPSLTQGLQLASSLATETTISKMALGAPPAQHLAFSSISLLAQSGRLPLVAPKELGGQAIANMLMIALRWLRQDGRSETFYRKGRYIELNPEDIPDHIVLECKLEPDLPQDKLQLASIAQLLTASGMMSKRWTRENILSAGQSKHMDAEIWKERREDFELQRILQKISAMDQAQIQQMIQQMQMQMQQQLQQQMQQQQMGQGDMPEGEGMPQEGGMAPSSMEEAAISEALSGAGVPPQIGRMVNEARRSGAFPPGARPGPGNPLTGPLPRREEQG